ncbi:FCD domain-containing protein [Sagittula sp. M10.9X]|uniref:FCD domain-containing protein n=1 Tax=Sagittula salina TaxID=2820268 RepID=A0A940S417_9RHOB|nr:FCD domain-containing protein [Sagittula salina]
MPTFFLGLLARPRRQARSRTNHSCAHHQMLCQALRARDGDTAARAISEDIRVASELITAHGALDTDNTRRRIIT